MYLKPHSSPREKKDKQDQGYDYINDPLNETFLVDELLNSQENEGMIMNYN